MPSYRDYGMEIDDSTPLTRSRSSGGGSGRSTPSRRTAVILLLLLLVVAAVLCGVLLGTDVIKGSSGSKGGSSGSSTDPGEFKQYFSTENVYNHLVMLREISASGTGPDSRSVLNKYEPSAEYVEAQLKLNGGSEYFTLSRQTFMAPVWTELEPPRLEVEIIQDNATKGFATFQPNADFISLRYGGSSDGLISGLVIRALDVGCEPGSYGGEDMKDRIAVVSDKVTETCDIYAKALNAEKLGAAAVVIHRTVFSSSLPNSRARATEWVPTSPNVTIPAFGVSYTVYQLLADRASVRLQANNSLVVAETFNVFAETKESHNDTVVLVGAHLDSVDEGPGINDNGSGSATILEIAMQLVREKLKLPHRLRFAWFGAEELGLLGSRHYVRELTQQEKDNIVLMLNFDMLGSPNYARIVYNGTSAPESSRAGSQKLQRLFEQYFTAQKLYFIVEPFSTTGGSDYFPFIHAGIPSGSIATGAGSLKSAQLRDEMGGIANTPFDSCYHAACDTELNINQQGLKEMALAAAYVTLQVAELPR